MTRDEARLRILTQQGLVAPFGDPMEAVKAMVAVQTQYAASLTTAVAARSRKLPRRWEETVLALGGALVKSWSVRHTLHAHLKEDHELILGCVGARYLERHRKWFTESFGADFDALLDDIHSALRKAPMSRTELHAQVPALKELPWAGWGQDAAGLAFQRRLCIIGRGASQKFAALDPGESTATPGALLRRYLEGFAPATRRDFAYWSGLPAKACSLAFEEIGPELKACEVEGLAGPHFVLKTQERPQRRRLGLKLLAKFDPLVLAHLDKSLFIKDKAQVFRKAGQVEAVVLSAGQAIGAWRLTRAGKTARIVVEPFRCFAAKELTSTEREAARMSKLLGFTDAEVQFREGS